MDFGRIGEMSRLDGLGWVLMGMACGLILVVGFAWADGVRKEWRHVVDYVGTCSCPPSQPFEDFHQYDDFSEYDQGDQDT